MTTSERRERERKREKQEQRAERRAHKQEPEDAEDTAAVKRKQRKEARERRKREEREGYRGRRVLRLDVVEAKCGLRKSQIYEGIENGTFPKPVPVSERAVAWLEDELDAWIEARIAVRDSGTAVRALPGQQREGGTANGDPSGAR
jgi:prophage regulatory protein